MATRGESAGASLTLYPSQEAYLKRLGDRPYLYAGMGTGKTRMALALAVRGGYWKVLVVTPPSVRDTKQWEVEARAVGLEDWFDEFIVVGTTWLQKWREHRLELFKDFAVIIDEAHRIKNPQSLQGRGAYELCRVVRRYWLLSGTPMQNWSEAANYAKITGLVRNKTAFYRRYIVQAPAYAHKGMDIVGYKHTDELARWWSSIAARLKTEECVELPSKIVKRVSIPVPRAAYLKLIKMRMTPDGEPLDNVPKLNWVLRAEAETADKKLQWAVEKIEGLENCLVFVNTKKAVEELGKRLKRAGIKYGVWTGSKKQRFENYDVMIVQYQAGGTGLNLQKFNSTIFLSPCYSYSDFTQAMARTWRNGQTKRCMFYCLEANNTIDERIYKALIQKHDFDQNTLQ